MRSLLSEGKGANQKAALVQTDANFPKKVTMYHVNFEGNFGTNHITPRGLKAQVMN